MYRLHISENNNSTHSFSFFGFATFAKLNQHHEKWRIRINLEWWLVGVAVEYASTVISFLSFSQYYSWEWSPMIQSLCCIMHEVVLQQRIHISLKSPCVPFGRAHPYALIPLKGLPSGVRASKGWRVQGTWSALLHHHPVPIWRRRHHEKNQRKESWGAEVSISCTLRNPSFLRALWSGQFCALRFGTTLQNGGHDCFHSEVPFRGRYIPFGTHFLCWTPW